MPRFFPALAGLALVITPQTSRADAFDNYTNKVLAKVPGAKGVMPLNKLTFDLMVKYNRVLPGVPGTFVVVRTNGGRYSKLLLQPAGQKIKGDMSVPIALVERFTTFQDGEEKAIHVDGKFLRLFKDFLLDLDMGQVVPAEVGGDLRFVVKGEDSYLETVGKAEMFLVTRHLPEATPKKLEKLVIGAVFEPRYFNGVYKLYDDGRRTGTLHLKVLAKGKVEGFYYSGKDGRKYDVTGEIGDPNYAINFRIIFPRSIQSFHGWLFTGDGRALVGSSRLQDRETGFYALRQETE